MSDNLKSVLLNPNNNDFELKPLQPPPPPPSPPVAPVQVPKPQTVAEMMANVGVEATGISEPVPVVNPVPPVVATTTSSEHIIISDEDLLNASAKRVEMEAAAAAAQTANSVQVPNQVPGPNPVPVVNSAPAQIPPPEKPSSITGENGVFASLPPDPPLPPPPPSNPVANTAPVSENSVVSQAAVEAEKAETISATGEKTVPLPKFLIIGSTKCSTSAFLRFLQLHPQMRSPGETYFFNKFYNNGIDYYKSKFEPYATKPDLILFEKTPTYYTCIDCPQRVKELDPNMKILISGKSKKYVNLQKK